MRKELKKVWVLAVATFVALATVATASAQTYYLSGDRVDGKPPFSGGPGHELRIMYTEPKESSADVFVPYHSEVVWIAYNTTGEYPAGDWVGHIWKYPAWVGCRVSIGVFDNETKTFTPYGSTEIGSGWRNDFVIHADAFTVGEDQYLAFAVYNPWFWLGVVTWKGVSYVTVPA